jgi:uncharacterized protein (DUF2235 family)
MGKRLVVCCDGTFADQPSKTNGRSFCAVARSAWGCPGTGGARTQQRATLFRRTYAQETPIRFIGVWDTVGALGIPSHPRRRVPTTGGGPVQPALGVP